MQVAQSEESRVQEAYESRTKRSYEIFRRAVQVAPGGVMAGIKFYPPYPIFVDHAKGSRITDVDGNEYIDYLMSYGALILGHGDARVRREVESLFEDFGTTVTGTPSKVEVDFGELLRDLYHKDGLIRFTNSGLEATTLAVRLARAHTRRRLVGKFEGHYHGANDRLLVSYAPALSEAGDPGRPTAVPDSLDVDQELLSESLVLPFNDWPNTSRLISENSHRLACVILEPFLDGVIAGDRAFMENLRRLTLDLGIPLIFDEVKTGFRIRVGGASEFYSITPDLACLGKIIGGGLPAGAVVGDGEIMRMLDPESPKDSRVFHSGTFNGNPLSLTAGRATVETLTRDNNFSKVVSRTSDLRSSVESALKSAGIPVTMAGEGGMFSYYITGSPVKSYRDVQSTDLRLRRYIDMSLLCRDVYLKPGGRFCLSLAHAQEDSEQTVAALEEILQPNSSKH